MNQDDEDKETYWDANGQAVPRRTRNEMRSLLTIFRKQIGPLDCWSMAALEELEDCWRYGIEQERDIRASGGHPNPRNLPPPV
jgi:hypothetical protein